MDEPRSTQYPGVHLSHCTAAVTTVAAAVAITQRAEGGLLRNRRQIRQRVAQRDRAAYSNHEPAQAVVGGNEMGRQKWGIGGTVSLSTGVGAGACISIVFGCRPPRKEHISPGRGHSAWAMTPSAPARVV